MYALEERSDAYCSTLIFSMDVFHQAHALKTDRVHVEGNDFTFDLVKVDNDDYTPTYFLKRWKGQKVFDSYESYDENAYYSLFLPFLTFFSQVCITEVNEYTVVLTGLILRHTKAIIYIKDDRIGWFYAPGPRLHVVKRFPKKDDRTLTINGLEQDLIFDSHFLTFGPIGAFHQVFFLQAHGVKDFRNYKYADITLDKKAGIGSVLVSLSKCSSAFNEIGLKTINTENVLGQFDSELLDKYFVLDKGHEDANESNTIHFPEIAGIKSIGFMYLAQPKIDLGVLKPNFLMEMHEYASAVLRGKRTLGLLIRGTDYINMFKTGTRLMSSPQEMAPMIDEWMKKYGYDKIFLATEDEDILEWMRNYYKDKLLAVSQERHRVGDLKGELLLADLNKPGDEDHDEHLEENIVNYFYALYMLSQCQAFICSGYCNGYDLVMSFNYNTYYHQNEFERVHLFQKGVEDK